MAYTDVTTIRRYLGVTVADDDTLLGELIARAQAMIDHYTGRTFEASANTIRYFDALRDVDGLDLILDYDLASINSVTNGDGTTVTAYVTEPRNSAPYHRLRMKSLSGLTWTYTTDPENAIAVSGKWAYSTSAPADIVGATVRLAAYMYRQKDNAGDLDRAVIAGAAVILPGEVPQDVRMMLNPYKRRTL